MLLLSRQAYLGWGSDWRAFARRFSQQTGYPVDLMIFYRKKPRIAMELKWQRERISRKDRESFNEAGRELKVQRAYYLPATRGVITMGRL